MKLFANDASVRAVRAAECNRETMKKLPVIAVIPVLALTLGSLGAGASRAAAEEGVALAIIYDTSGSMKETVKDASGKPTAKYLIANRALTSIAREIQGFSSKTSNGPRKVEAGVFIFDHDHAKEVVKYGAFDQTAIENWAKGFSNPSGSTPLGNALTEASKPVIESALSRKHILVITDGINTAGPAPDKVLPKLLKRSMDKGSSLGVHFVAFDVDAKVFDGVKKQGATVVAAADEKQLDSQLQYILEKKILLEDEEPAKKP